MKRAGERLVALERRAYALAKRMGRKVFPSSWSFLLGEIALFSFMLLVGTGIYLVLFYEAGAHPVRYDGAYEPLQGLEVPAAYRSVLDITFDRPFGRVIRQTHHWAALVFVAAVVLHAARVFFTGAYRRPRRLNWAIGVTLMGLAMANGYFGFTLPHDVLGGTSARIGHAFSVSVPVVGAGIADMLFGGEFGNTGMLRRLWQLHVVILPATITLLLLSHLALVWVQTHTQFRADTPSADVVTGASGLPGYTLKTVGLGAVVTGVIVAAGALVTIAPIWIYGPFDPTASSVPAQPDWYLAWVEGALRILPGIDVVAFGREIPSPFFVGVALPMALFMLLYAWPFLEERLTGDHAGHHLLDRPRHHPVRTALGATVLTAMTVLMAAASHDQQAAWLGVPVEAATRAYQVALVALPLGAGLLAAHTCRVLVRDEQRLDQTQGTASRRAR
jgi:ubiquinol-cytochrome c reductase cytochrome b subunit